MPDDLLLRVTAALADRYRIERELGRGSMASVFLAADRLTGHPLAVKVLHPSFAASLGSERFIREVRFVSALDHPNILPVLDCALSGPILYYAMRYADGGSLGERIERHRSLALEETLMVARGVAAAIDYAHRQHVLHRDIKPGNILFDRGRPVVCDFGVARAMVTTAGVAISSGGLVVGTPYYVSPEQAVSARDIDGRADVYSLACVLYEMLTGEKVFSGATAQAVLARHLNDTPRPVRTLRPDLPEPVERAILVGLAKNPGNRPATAGELVRRMEE